MPDSPAFDYVSRALSDRTSLEAIEARGTVRIALKLAGLKAAAVTREQMAVVLERIMPGELEKRGISGAAALCDRMKSEVVSLERGDLAQQSPESVFQRLGGGR
jgi:hypothetical protein